jgi:hypothetical protein
MGVLPANGEGFVHLHVLASLYAAPAKDALVGVISVKGIGKIRLERLRLERDFLMLNSEHLCRVMDGAIPVIIVADRAVKHVVTEDPIEGQALGSRGPSRTGVNFHPCYNDGCAGPYELSIYPRPYRCHRSEWDRVAYDNKRKGLCYRIARADHPPSLQRADH